MNTIGTLIANLALADIRKKRLELNGLAYAQQVCVCGHRRDDHLIYAEKCMMPCECVAFVAAEE